MAAALYKDERCLACLDHITTGTAIWRLPGVTIYGAEKANGHYYISA